jgi:hypothetical protein
MVLAPDLAIRRHANDLRGMWQGRVLEHSEGRMMLVVASMLAHAHPEHFHILMIVAKPVLWDTERGVPKPPFLASIGKIATDGAIVADVREPGMLKPHEMQIFKSVDEFQGLCRKLADRARLSDPDREQFFICAKNWLAADRRIDPATGEKRIVH